MAVFLVCGGLNLSGFSLQLVVIFGDLGVALLAEICNLGQDFRV